MEQSPGTSPDWAAFDFGTPSAEPFTLATYVSASQPALAPRDATTTSARPRPARGNADNLWRLRRRSLITPTRTQPPAAM